MSAESDRWREVRNDYSGFEHLEDVGDALADRLDEADRRIAELESANRELHATLTDCAEREDDLRRLLARDRLGGEGQ